MTNNLVITPAQGTFDIEAVREWLDARPDTFEDPRPTYAGYVCSYLLYGVPIYAFFMRECILRDPTKRAWTYTVYLSANMVILDQEYGSVEGARSALDFLIWFTQRFDCRIQIDGGCDITDEIRRNAVGSLYPDDVRSAHSPWTGTLIPIGFFWELSHCRTADPSLEESIQLEPLPEETALARYLEAGHVLIRAKTTTIDPLVYEPEVNLGLPHRLTDGDYVWPADLPYYLRTYHVRLPRAFVIHARRNDWRVPPVDIASLPLFTDFEGVEESEE